MIEQSGKESRALVEGRATDSRGVSAGASGRVVSGSEWQAFKEQAAFFVKSGLLPKAVGSVEAALTIMVTGYELGIGPMQALRLISVVQGKPVCAAELMAALVYRDHGDEALCVEESTAERCVVSYKRRCWTERKSHTFSMVDARTAGLAGKDTWKSYPAAMLRARCISAVARMAFPDTISGLYTPEEMAPEQVQLGSEGDVVDDALSVSPEPEPARAPERPQEAHEEAGALSFTERAAASLEASGEATAAHATPREDPLAQVREEVVELLAADASALDLLRTKGTLPADMDAEQLGKTKRWLGLRAARNVPASSRLAQGIEAAGRPEDLRAVQQQIQRAKDERTITHAEYVSLLRQSETRRQSLGAGPLTAAGGAQHGRGQRSERSPSERSEGAHS